MKFFRPNATRLVSKTPVAPEAKRAKNEAVSSTVTFPVPEPSGKGTLVDEGGEHSRDLSDFAHKEAREVHDVHGGIAQSPGPGPLLLEPPGKGKTRG
jgi:hypothetical protein